MDKKQEHYAKVKKILSSCQNRFHLKTAVKVINQFNQMYQIGEQDPEYVRLKQMLDLMKIKCGVKSKSYNDEEQIIDEENTFLADKSDWQREINVAGLTGVFAEDKIKGGLADDKTIKDIAKKHNVKVGDIRKQIEMGIDVEREHTDSDKMLWQIWKKIWRKVKN
jgi:hypothetical protein